MKKTCSKLYAKAVHHDYASILGLCRVPSCHLRLFGLCRPPPNARLCISRPDWTVLHILPYVSIIPLCYDSAYGFALLNPSLSPSRHVVMTASSFSFPFDYPHVGASFPVSPRDSHHIPAPPCWMYAQNPYGPLVYLLTLIRNITCTTNLPRVSSPNHFTGLCFRDHLPLIPTVRYIMTLEYSPNNNCPRAAQQCPCSQSETNQSRSSLLVLP